MKRNLVIIAAVIAGIGATAWLKNQRRPPNEPVTGLNGQRLPRLVELGAGKCVACREMAPIIASVREEYAGKVSVETIDVIAEPDRARPYNWTVIPCQVFIDANEREVWRHVGFLPRDEIDQTLTAILKGESLPARARPSESMGAD